MAIYDEWKNLLENVNEENFEYFEREYYGKEAALYQKLLAEKQTVIEGRFDQLCEQYGFEPVMFAGFLEGINTSIEQPLELKKLRINSRIHLDIDFKKLYVAMQEAKAKHLYTMPEWDNVFTAEERSAIMKEYHLSKQAVSTKIDRNAPCPCGSGKKYKKCCGSVLNA